MQYRISFSKHGGKSSSEAGSTWEPGAYLAAHPPGAALGYVAPSHDWDAGV